MSSRRPVIGVTTSDHKSRLARFFDWLAEFKPTWYSAVPTMHQAVLAEADQHTEIVAQANLRLIRSSSRTFSMG